MPRPVLVGNIRFWRDPALPYIEVRQASDSRACYQPHTHPGFSLGLVDAGMSHFEIAAQTFLLGPGSVVLIPPNAVHACNPDLQARWAYRMIYLESGGLARILDEALHDLQRLPTLLTDPADYALVSQLADSLCSDGDPLLKEDLLAHTLEELLRRHAQNWKVAQPMPAQWLTSVQVFLSTHFAEPLNLDAVAAEAGISLYHLIRSFKAACGLTPHAWLLDLRINRARELLRNTQLPLSEIALQTGFADQSHFSRCFKERMAVTPGQYRNSAE